MGSSLTLGLGGCVGSLLDRDDGDEAVERTDERVTGSWPMRNYDARNTRSVALSGVREPKHAYTTAVGSSSNSDVLVADSLAFTGARGGTEVAAIEVATGDRNRSVTVDGTAGSPLAVTDETLFLLDDGIVTAIDHQSGEREWEYELGQFPAGFVATDSTVFFTVPASPELVALDRTRGNERFRYEFVRSPGTLAVSDGTAYVAMDEQLYAIASRDRRWHRQFGSDISHVTVADDALFVTDGGGTVTRLEANGEVKWTRAVASTTGNTAVRGERLYVATGGRIVAVDRASGEWEPLDVESNELTRITSASDQLYASRGRELVGFDPERTDVTWRHTFDQFVSAGPTVLSGAVLVRTSGSSGTDTGPSLHAIFEAS